MKNYLNCIGHHYNINDITKTKIRANNFNKFDSFRYGDSQYNEIENWLYPSRRFFLLYNYETFQGAFQFILHEMVDVM